MKSFFLNFFWFYLAGFERWVFERPWDKRMIHAPRLLARMIHRDWYSGGRVFVGFNYSISDKKIAVVIPLWFPGYRGIRRPENNYDYEIRWGMPVVGIAVNTRLFVRSWFMVTDRDKSCYEIWAAAECNLIRTTALLISYMKKVGFGGRKIRRELRRLYGARIPF